MLFKEGDYIFYGSGGICIVDSIREMPFEGARAGVPYYVLHTLAEPKQTILNPTDNDKVLMRAVMTKKEACDVLSALPSLMPFEAENARALREKYMNAIKSASPTEWCRVLCTYETRRRATEAKLARVTEAERGFYTQALSLLSAEVALAEGVSVTDASAEISDVVKNEIKTSY